MATGAPFLPMLLGILRLATCSFPEEPGPLISAPAEVARRYPVFLGRAHRSYMRQEPLYIQSVLKVNRTLYIGARDDLYRVELDHVSGDEMFYSKKRTWESNKNDIRICRMKGKHEEECRNYMKVLLSQHGGLFVCGTNAFNPLCANYTRDTLEMVGEPISGMARCPYDPKHANVALFAEGSLFTGTVTDFLAIDAVIYRSLGDGPALRTIKHDSKWFREPYFVSAVEWGPHIYFFFREMAMEFNYLEKVMVSRVARVCKGDLGGSQRVLEKQWTSFLKARLNCSIPGDSHFYFNLLQSTSPIIRMHGRDIILGVFSTPPNSIPGSAVCAFDMQQLARVFEGRFKEQKSPESIWTPVPDELVPKPRPGGCAGQGSRFSSSTAFPDEVLNFIKTHPLMDEAVPLLGHRPWIVKTMVRYQLNTMVVDTEAGPHRNRTVVFLGSTRGTVLKFLIIPGRDSPYSNTNIFLEELEGYNPERCGDDSIQARQPLSLTLDRPSHTLLLAFHSCVVRLPVARCQLHSRCMKNCISSRDPYCGWTRGSTCSLLRPGTRLPFVQDVEYGNITHLGDCDGLLHESFMDEPESLVTLNLLVVAAVSAFSTGAALSGLAVCWIMGQKHRHRSRSNTSSSSSGGNQRKSEKERSMLGPSGSGSVMSVSRHSVAERSRPQGETLFVMPNGWVKAGDLDPGLLPTPEQTPLQQKRPPPGLLRLSDSGSGWDQSQTFLNSVGTQCPPPPPSAIFLSSKLLQGAGDRRHDDTVDRQRYVSLSRYREQAGRPGTLLRKSAGDYDYPVTPQDSPDRRRVVSAPSTQMEYGGETLRWTHEGYIFSHAAPPSGHHYGPAGPHLTRSVLHGSRGLVDLAEFSHLLGKGGVERAPSGQ
ncbi:sema domain, transmembrane domain (TM), and cytoplasmic domain, (semaphorin) 6Ba [Pygocentrus nattereri]|uniref:Semaphorin-6B n=1 Tax=Pygocentrus nattereri TaxID=42514 RepID=A0A3B4C3N9_PYGNA|nr:sema domain, transmembrane domain (TM), and cytoplasmic domain, (semaphorin) 6Ba [Pygocentrus nattereri]XP_037387048.1 sema domain, transmembrane domain (TM), and cytoplasmic domain, (semaphorin) 6Ba [Pygocentrus nattereri]